MRSKLSMNRTTRALGVVVVIGIGLIGARLLITSHGQSPAASVAATSGSIAAPATVQSSSSAFGGKYVQFGNPSPGYFNVVSYGADPSGKNNSDPAIKAAVAAAEAAGVNQTVYFPAGTYILNSNTETNPNVNNNDIDITSTDGSVVNILGAGQSVTKVIEEVGNAQMVNGKTGPYPSLIRGENVFNFDTTTSGFYFSGLTVDAQAYNAGDALDDHGNNSVIENSTFLGSINGPGSAGLPGQTTTWEDTFDIRDLHFCNQSKTNPNYVGNPANHGSGNSVKNVTLISAGGKGGNDDLDFTCQENGTISNITDTGWGTALYLDSNVTITNYNFTPGSDSTNSQYFYGFYVTDGNNITINNFQSSGKGGIVSSPNFPSSNITINNEQMSAAGYNLNIADSTNTVINGSKLQELKLDPQSNSPADSSTGAIAGGINGLTFSSSSYGTLTCDPGGGAPIIGLVGLTCDK